MTAPQAQNAEDARREYMTKVIMVCVGLVTIPFTLITLLGWPFGLFPLDTVILLGAVSLVFSCGWVLANQGHWQSVGYIPPLMVFTAAVYGSFVGGIDAPAMLLYAIAIILTIMLQGASFYKVMTALSLGAFLLLGLAHNQGYLPTPRSANTMFVNRVTIVILSISIVTILTWFLRSQYQRALDEARRNSESLRESEEKFRTILSAMVDLVLAFDAEGRVIFFHSPPGVEYFRAPEGFLGRPLEHFVPQPMWETCEAAFQANRSGSPAEFDLSMTLDQEPKWFSVTLSPKILDGQYSGSIAVIRDITGRKRAEEEIQALNAHLDQRVRERTLQLEATNRELESFSYSVSHDLRAPLRCIEGYARILLDDYLPQLDEEGANYLKRIDASISHMRDLIDNLLKLARVTRTSFARQPVDLSALASTILDELQTAEPHRLVERRVEAGLIAHADKLLICIALENLLGNAWKFSAYKHPSRIEIGKQMDGERTVFYVRDNGAGFDMAYADRLFGVFQRLHSDSEFPGTGVGLATVKKIIQRHGGSIWVDAAVDQGATFFFTLPGE